MIYLRDKDKKYIWDDETIKLFKVQIDNSLELGWDRKDIILVTNFPYEYNGVKALEMDVDFFKTKPTTAKIFVICEMFEQGLIEDDLYWFHDLDAFQLDELTPNISPGKIGLTDYGITRMGPKIDERWSTGTIFFDNKTEDVFKLIRRSVTSHNANEEIGLLAWYRVNKHNIRDRLEKINITYNFATRKRSIKGTYEVCDKPIKVIHFHPFDDRIEDHSGTSLEICVYGKNKVGIPLVTDKLINIFKKHEII